MKQVLPTAPLPAWPRNVAQSARIPVWALSAGLAIAVAALALRLLYLDLIPRFTDETDVVTLALAVARGERLPLTDTDAYIGAGFVYLLSLVFVLLGPDAVLPRYVAVAVGTVTLGAAFLFGRELALAAARHSPHESDARGAVVAGLLAAALLAVSPVHILVNSRLAWSHGGTPLFTTAALWLLARAARLGHGPSLALAGLFFGIALQSHPTVLALLPGAAGWILWRGRSLLRSRWLGLAIVLGALGCSSLLIYNLSSGFGSIREGLAKAQAYAVQEVEPPDYAGALGLELGGAVRALAGAVGEQRGDLVPLFQPDTLIWAVVAPLGLAFSARRGVGLPGFVVIPFLLILPAMNAKYQPLSNGRYLMPVVIVAWAATALLVVMAWRWVMAGSWWRQVALISALALALVDPIASLIRYERAALADGGNVPYLDLADRIRREYRAGEQVLIDVDLGGTRVASGRRGVGVLQYLLTVDPNPLPVASGSASELVARLKAGSGDQLLVLLPRARRIVAARLPLEPVGRSPTGREARLANVGLYRVVADAAEPAPPEEPGATPPS